ncbi:MAG: alpha/beta hydrolase [Sphaerochaetaceae bacterium]|jgi:acetyl esterase/lipase|nr:alpha/beta hydrolase [Sphaerochaetaceae bacterium]MDD3366326.1 alpha/beta hydrolase [Sphaerochaetaceae bacterium]MDD4220556.1 alpha/beta hydrolase [Sphaerochaetaceae bacterium]
MAYVIFLSIIGAFSGFALYITRKEKRSFRSWSSEQMLHLRLKKGWFGASNDPVQYLAERALINSQPYQIPTPLKLLGNVERKEIADLDCVLLQERNGTSATRILYLHGGAYVEQPILPHWLFLERINNQCKAIITVPLYPKAPTYTFEEGFTKIVNLYTTLLKTSSARNIVIMGDSAGGGLALALTQHIAKQKLPLPKAAILISPWLDITLRNADITPLEAKDPMLNRSHLQVIGRSWVGSGDPHDWRVSPINGILEGLPPLTIFVGTHELFLADARKMRLLCKRKGVFLDYQEYPKMNHAFPLFPIPEAKKAQAKIVEIIQQA